MTPQFTLSIEPTDDDDTISVSSSSTGDSFFNKNSIQEISSYSDSESSVDMTMEENNKKVNCVVM